jgi:hypothetical protein
MTTTGPDDVFYILKSVVARLLSTGSVTCTTKMVEQLRDIVDRDYAGVYKRKLDDVYKSPVGQGGARSDKGERESRLSFIVSAVPAFKTLFECSYAIAVDSSE